MALLGPGSHPSAWSFVCIAFIPEQVASLGSHRSPQQPRLCSEEQIASCPKNPSQTLTLSLSGQALMSAAPGDSPRPSALSWVFKGA